MSNKLPGGKPIPGDCRTVRSSEHAYDAISGAGEKIDETAFDGLAGRLS